MGLGSVQDGDVDSILEEAATAEELEQAALPGADIPFASAGLTGPNSTGRLLEVLTRLERVGIPLDRSMVEVAGPFPVAGRAYWTDDWHACRDGCTRLHEGLDIFAPRNTPLVATADAIVTQKAVGLLAGRYVEMQDEAGVQYLYAHLEDWAAVEVGQVVHTGDVLGFVGNSGNAISTPTHVHFEVQPEGIPAPPKPYVDAWAELALRSAEAYVYVEDLLGSTPRPTNDSPLERLAATTSKPTVPVDPASVFLAGEESSGSCGLALGSSKAEQMAWEMDWLKEQAPDLTGSGTDLAQSAVYLRLRWLDCWMDSAAEGVGNAGR